MTRSSRREFAKHVAAAAAAWIVPSVTFGQKPTMRVPRVGFLIGVGFPTMAAAFSDEMRKLGYANGKNVIIEMRFGKANSNDLEPLVAELMALDLDVIVAAALPIALAIRRGNTQVPLVVATGPALVENGLANSLSQPGLHTTGLDELPPGLTGRRLTLLKRAAPKMSRVALLSTTPGRGGHEIQLADAERAANTMGISVKALSCNPSD
jgi:putative tryptophan/tyrosine transport system substrate-binding protein